MANRLIIIGDSFAKPSNDQSFYGRFLEKDFTHLDMTFGGHCSRDIQTIIDDWVKVIPIMDENDYLIVAIPTFSRTRLPLEESEWRDTFPSYLEGQHQNKFIGTSSYTKGKNLEFFGGIFDSAYFQSMLNPQSIINSTRAAEKNFFEIIEALKKITKPKVYAFSWERFGEEARPFDDRNDLFAKIGIWKTISDAYAGDEKHKDWWGDPHWAAETHHAFAELIKIEFGLKRRMI